MRGEMRRKRVRRFMQAPGLLALGGAAIVGGTWHRADGPLIHPTSSRLPQELGALARWSRRTDFFTTAAAVVSPDGRHVALVIEQDTNGPPGRLPRSMLLASRPSPPEPPASEAVARLRTFLPFQQSPTRELPPLIHMEVRGVTSGRLAWKRRARFGTRAFPPAVADDRFLYLLRDRDLAALDWQSGKVRWKQTLRAKPLSLFTTPPFVAAYHSEARKIDLVLDGAQRTFTYPNTEGWRRATEAFKSGPGGWLMSGDGETLSWIESADSVAQVRARADSHLQRTQVWDVSGYSPALDRWFLTSGTNPPASTTLHAMDGAGRCRWERRGVEYLAQAPTDGVVLAGSDTHTWVLDARTGVPRWTWSQTGGVVVGEGWAAITQTVSIKLWATIFMSVEARRLSDGKLLGATRVPPGVRSLIPAGRGFLWEETLPNGSWSVTYAEWPNLPRSR